MQCQAKQNLRHKSRIYLCIYEHEIQKLFFAAVLYNIWWRFVVSTSLSNIVESVWKKEQKITSRLICQSSWRGSIWKNIYKFVFGNRESGRENIKKRWLVQSLVSIDRANGFGCIGWFSKYTLYWNHCFSLTLSNLYFTQTHAYTCTLWDFYLVNLPNAINVMHWISSMCWYLEHMCGIFRHQNVMHVWVYAATQMEFVVIAWGYRIFFFLFVQISNILSWNFHDKYNQVCGCSKFNKNKTSIFMDIIDMMGPMGIDSKASTEYRFNYALSSHPWVRWFVKLWYHTAVTIITTALCCNSIWIPNNDNN